ncbi:MAG: hypothetical protein R3Y63_04430 [Eubacteriales bacterium]
MNKMSVEPIKAVNGVPFGTDREKVRSELSSEYTEFKKSKFSKNTADDCKLFHVFYDSNNNFQAVETFGDIPVVVGDIDVFSLKVTELHLLSGDFIEDQGSYVSVEKSIGVTFENGTITSVLFGCPKYYE